MEEEKKSECKPVSIGDWMITIFIMTIPIVNIVMLFVWAFNEGTNRSKANWAKAILLLIAISILIYIILFILLMEGFPLFFPFLNSIDI